MSVQSLDGVNTGRTGSSSRSKYIVSGDAYSKLYTIIGGVFSVHELESHVIRKMLEGSIPHLVLYILIG